MVRKIKTFFFTNFWLIWAIFVALVVLLYWFAFLPENGLERFFSSDCLYLPSLYRDFFQDGYSLDGWRLNQATNFFPDMLLFFILNALFGGNFILAAFSFSVVQYLFIIFMFYLIFKIIKPDLHTATFAPAIFLFASYLFLLFLDGEIRETLFINRNSFHNSAFTMGVLCIYLFLKYLDTKSRKLLVSILILSVLCGASDKLFFINFTAPVACVAFVLFFVNVERKTLTKFLFYLAIGTLLGIALWIYFKNNSYFKLTKPPGEISLDCISQSWKVFSEQLLKFLSRPSLRMVITYISLATYIAVIRYVLRNIIKLFKKQRSVDAMFVFQLFVLFFTPIVLLTPVLAGSYLGPDMMRYNYFPYILLPFNAVILLGNWLNRNKLVRLLINTTLSILLLGYLLIHFSVRDFSKGLDHYFNFYPEKAMIVDSFFQDDNLKYGVTNEYWTAKQATMFSKKGVRLYCVKKWGEPWLHVSNKYWFIEHNKGKHAHCEFTFLLWSKDVEVAPIYVELFGIDSIQPIELNDWHLYKVKPYRFIMPGTRFGVEPVIIQTPPEYHHNK